MSQQPQDIPVTLALRGGAPPEAAFAAFAALGVFVAFGDLLLVSSTLALLARRALTVSRSGTGSFTTSALVVGAV